LKGLQIDKGEENMKIVVIGGSGLIGSKAVAVSRQPKEGFHAYKAGQSFSELPGDRHGVSANASKTKPAKLLAVFVVDTNETELTAPFAN
jgi:hypothetical protein